MKCELWNRDERYIEHEEMIRYAESINSVQRARNRQRITPEEWNACVLTFRRCWKLGKKRRSVFWQKEGDLYIVQTPIDGVGEWEEI